MGRLIGIAIKPQRKAPMVECTKARVTKENGIRGDARGAGGSDRSRQITIVSETQWQKVCNDLSADLPWTHRRANLFVQGMNFSQKSIGSYLHIGEHVVLEITGETTPCNRMDEEHPGLQAALTPTFRGGATCRVIRGGIIRQNDAVRLSENMEVIDNENT